MHILQNLHFFLKTGSNLDTLLHDSLVLPFFEIERVELVNVGWGKRVNRHLLSLGAATTVGVVAIYGGLRAVNGRDLVLASTSLLGMHTERFLSDRILVGDIDTLVAMEHIDMT